LHIGNDREKITLAIGGNDGTARDPLQANLHRPAVGSSSWYSRVLSKLAVHEHEAHLTLSHRGYADMPCKMPRQPETLCIKGHAQYGRQKFHHRMDVESAHFVAERLGSRLLWKGRHPGIR